MFIIYAITHHGYKKEVNRFWNGRKAFDFCKEMNWEYIDPETNFSYDLIIEEE
jgi:DNA polymerase/3'-5' exonuclease PolX